MSLKPPTPGQPGYDEWRDLADAVDAAGVLGGGAADQAELAAQYEAWDRQSTLACLPEPGVDERPADEEMCHACKGSGEGPTVNHGDGDMPTSCRTCGGNGTVTPGVGGLAESTFPHQSPLPSLKEE